jgi:hypothetical protein
MKKLLLPALLAILCCFTACRQLDPAGVYQSDQPLYNAHLTIVTSYDVIHTFVTWEAQNRAALAKYPQITQAADAMRKNSKQWFTTAEALADAYKADPSQQNKDALTTALNVLQAALSQAAAHMSTAATASAKTATPQPAQ